MLKFKTLLALIVLCFTTNALFAQIDTIRLQDKRLNTAVLKPVLNQYMVYFQTPANNKTLRFWFWLRDIKKTTRNGESVFTITQHWYGSDSSMYRYAYSVNRATDFAPLYHEEDYQNKINAYNWSEKQINGADTVAKNSKNGFVLDFSSPNFNWNLDIETFEMLPLAPGKTFAVNFYDAGFDVPAYVLYKVSGSELLTTLDDKKVDCWKLYTEGTNNGEPYSETFWISKRGHEFLKEEDKSNGMYRYKIKLLGSAADLLKRFTNK